jgi:outer membrane receptor protein involved in Fe transport
MNESFVGFKVNFQNAFYELPGALTCEEWKASRKKAKYGGDWARLWSFAGAFNSKIKLSDAAVLYVDGGFSKQYRHAVYRSSLSDLEFDYYSYSFTPRYVNDKDVFGRRNRFAAGVDLFYDDFRENHPLSWGSKGVKRSFERLRNAYYVHDEFSLTDEISLSAGARLEMIHNRFNGYSSVREHSDTDIMDDYELGVAYRPKDGLKLYAKGSVFHRSAFCDEMSYTKSGNLLEPETGFSFDAGFEWDILENLDFSVDAYAMRMKDEIFFDSTLLPFGYNSNCGENTQRFGFDAMLSYEKEEEFSFSVGYGAVKAEIDGGGFGDIPFVPNHRVRSEFGVFAAEGLEVKIGFSYTGQKYLSGDYKNEGERLKGYALFDFGVYYEPKWLDGVNISFSVNNLFDRSYCDYAAYIAPPGSPCYYPSAGRLFLFGVSYEF